MAPNRSTFGHLAPNAAVGAVCQFRAGAGVSKNFLCANIQSDKFRRAAGLAQMVEHLICNQGVGSSILSPGTKSPDRDEAV